MKITHHNRINAVKIMSFAVGASVIIMPVTSTSGAVYASPAVQLNIDSLIDTRVAVVGNSIAADTSAPQISKPVVKSLAVVKSGGSGFHSFFSGITHIVTSIVHSAASLISSGVKAVSSTIGHIAQGIGHVMGSVASGIVQGVSNVAKTAFSTIGNIISGIGHLAGEVIGGAAYLGAGITLSIATGVFLAAAIPGVIVGSVIYGVSTFLNSTIFLNNIKQECSGDSECVVDDEYIAPFFSALYDAFVPGFLLASPFALAANLLENISQRFGYLIIGENNVSPHTYGNLSQSIKSFPTSGPATVQNSPAYTQDMTHTAIEDKTKLPVPTLKSQDIIVPPQVSLLG